MNPNELFQRYLHGAATDAEVAELDRLLASDRALRRKLIVEIGIDAGLCEIAGERASQPSVVAPRRSVWLSWLNSGQDISIDRKIPKTADNGI